MPLPDVDDLAVLGGIRTNRHPVVDPTTDVGAEHLNPAFNDIVMMTHTAPRAWVIWTGITYTSGTMTIVPDDHNAMWGSGTGVRPLVQQSATGALLVTWTASQLDQLGVSHPLNIRFPLAHAYGVSTLIAKVLSWTANTVTINTYSAGALNALNGTKIALWWI